MCTLTDGLLTLSRSLAGLLGVPLLLYLIFGLWLRKGGLLNLYFDLTDRHPRFKIILLCYLAVFALSLAGLWAFGSYQSNRCI
jgi:hypothetical protein